ncbi:MAG: hypothetical protein CMJ59_00255 [Planctomycetaceae bacterium]|nr:hypothetical protein [Planctomycetaceae bacterium]
MAWRPKKQLRRRVHRKIGSIDAQQLLERIDQHYRHLTVGLDELEARLAGSGEAVADEPGTAQLGRRKPR